MLHTLIRLHDGFTLMPRRRREAEPRYTSADCGRSI